MQINRIAKVVLPRRKWTSENVQRLEDIVGHLVRRAEQGRTHEWKYLVTSSPASLRVLHLTISMYWFKEKPLNVQSLIDALMRDKHQPEVRELAYYLTLYCLKNLSEFGFIPKLNGQVAFNQVAKQIYDIFYNIILKAK